MILVANMYMVEITPFNHLELFYQLPLTVGKTFWINTRHLQTNSKLRTKIIHTLDVILLHGFHPCC